MEPMTDTQLATSALISCPTATIMSGTSSSAGTSGGSSASHQHHHQHHHHQHHQHQHHGHTTQSKHETALSPCGADAQTTTTGSMVTSKEDEEDSSNAASSDCKSPGQRYVLIITILIKPAHK